MNKFVIVALVIVGFILFRGSNFGSAGQSDDMHATAAVSLAAGTLANNDTPEVVHKVPRSKCTHCKGTGKIKSGDGIFEQDCPYCEPDKSEVPVVAPDAPVAATPKVEPKVEPKSEHKCGPNCKCGENCTCENGECLKTAKSEGKCGPDCKCENCECKNKECLVTTFKTVSYKAESDISKEDKIAIAQASLTDAAKHYKEKDLEGAARAVEFATQVLSADNFAAKSPDEENLSEIQRKIVRARANLEKQGVNMQAVVILNRAEYEDFLAKYYKYVEENKQLHKDYQDLKKKYEGNKTTKSTSCANGNCFPNTVEGFRVLNSNGNNGGCVGGNCGGGGCSSCGGGRGFF